MHWLMNMTRFYIIGQGHCSSKRYQTGRMGLAVVPKNLSKLDCFILPDVIQYTFGIISLQGKFVYGRGGNKDI